MSGVKCSWRDRYTARYVIVTEDAVTIDVTGRVAEADAYALSLSKRLGFGDVLPEPVPYKPPVTRNSAPRPLDPAVVAKSEQFIRDSRRSRIAGEAMPRTCHDALPGEGVS
jgi:hypothetical protein